MKSPALIPLALLVACGSDPADTTAAATDPGTGPAAPGSTSTGAPTTGPAPGTSTEADPGTTELPDLTIGGFPPDPTLGSSTGTTAGEQTTGTTGDPPPPPPDACAMAEPTCDGQVPAKAGGGLVEVDRCGFPMHDRDTWAVQSARVEALSAVLPRVALAELPAADFNRAAVPIDSVPGGVAGVVQAFRWDDEDNDKPTWIPQGITGTADAVESGEIGGRELVLVSWYHDTKGARISVVDVTVPDDPRYRHVLLVEPIDGDPISFKPIPIHAGGMVWFGDLLYVVETGKGFRVFDTRALLRVDTTVDSIGYDAGDDAYYGGLYKYVMPQIGAYQHMSECKPRFSSVALDRTSDPPTLVSSEYCNASDSCAGALHGRVYRWPLDPQSGRLAAPLVWPLDAHYMAQSHVQGGIAIGGDYYFSSSAPAGAGGALYVLPGGGPSETVTWVDTPEDLMRAGDRLWSLSEGTGIRTVYAVELADLP